MKRRKTQGQRCSAEVPNRTLGVDIGDRVSVVCGVDAAGQVVLRRRVATTPQAI